MKIYLIRHAQTENNIKRIDFNGLSNQGLSTLGKKQAMALAEFLSKEKLDAIFSSQLKRAKQTAKIVNIFHKIKIKETKLLNEANFGIFEGLTREEAKLKFPKIFAAREKDKYLYKIPKGESYQDIGIRIKQFFSRLEKYSYKTVAIITHVTVIKLILKEILNISLKEAESRYYPNTSITLINFNKNRKKYVLEYVNSYNHLKLID